MIGRYLLLLLALTAGAVAAFQFAADTGYVLVSFRGTTVETSLLGLGFGVAALVLAVYYGLVLLQAALRLPAEARRHYERRKAEAARLSFEYGIARLFEGRWQRAEVELVRRAADHHAGHLNYLAAARAAQRLGASERRDHYLRLVAERAPRQKFVLLLTQAELQRERGEWSAVRASASELHAIAPEHAYATELLAESLRHLADWPALRRLLAEPASAASLGNAAWQALAVQSTTALLAQAVTDADLAALKAVWTATPDPVRAAPDAARAYADGLVRRNAEPEARAFIEARLTAAYDEALVRSYGALHTDDAIAQLATIERWLQLHGEHPALLETAGAVCARHRLWGRARSYLEAVLAKAPTAAAYLEMARLAERSGEPAEAAVLYKQGLERLVASPTATNIRAVAL